MKRYVIIAIIVITLALDQIIKVYVKTNMMEGQSIKVIGDFFQINFVENEGAAFGLKFGSELGKFFLVLFRIILFGFLVHHLWKKSKQPVTFLYLTAISLIAAGALGNIVDNVFYDVWFNPTGGHFMKGNVVDMFYFPLWGLNHFIFNLADAAITIGLLLLIIFPKTRQIKAV